MNKRILKESALIAGVGLVAGAILTIGGPFYLAYKAYQKGRSLVDTDYRRMLEQRRDNSAGAMEEREKIKSHEIYCRIKEIRETRLKN